MPQSCSAISPFPAEAAGPVWERSTLFAKRRRMAPACTSIPTPFGLDLLVAARDGTVVASDFVRVRRKREAPVRDPLLREARAQVRAYLAKRLDRFDLPLHLEGTPFQLAVWWLVTQLETGELISYGDVARAIGHPLSHRGVAAAMGRSPLDLFIPAHRVVGSDGTVKGAPPNALRRRILAFEGIVLR